MHSKHVMPLLQSIVFSYRQNNCSWGKIDTTQKCMLSNQHTMLCIRDQHGQDWIGLNQEWCQFWQDKDWFGLQFFWKLADQDWIGLRKFMLFQCDYSEHIQNFSTDLLNGRVYTCMCCSATMPGHGVVKSKPAHAIHNMTCHWSVDKHFSLAPESSRGETELECFVALLWLNGKLSCGKSD